MVLVIVLVIVIVLVTGGWCGFNGAKRKAEFQSTGRKFEDFHSDRGLQQAQVFEKRSGPRIFLEKLKLWFGGTWKKETGRAVAELPLTTAGPIMAAGPWSTKEQ